MMEWHGHAGRILEVDLTRNKFDIKKLNEKDVRDFIGGMGLNCKLAADLLKKDLDPFSQENKIIIGAGPLVGTLTPASSRLVGICKFPATGAIANVCGSMSFGMHLKHAGFDHVIISGISEQPVYLKIEDDDLDLCSAEEIWGKDIFETTDHLKKKHGCSGVIAIGRAGENFVKSSLTLIDKTSTFGRGGLGAVMGSKKLKAILVKGSKGITISNPKEFKKLYDKLFQRIRNYSHLKDVHKLGMLRGTPISALLGASGQKAKSKQASERFYLKKLKKRRMACPSCPLGDKDVLEIKEGEFSGLISFTPSIINPFFMLLLKDLETSNQAVKAFDIISRHGLDALTITALLDFCTTLHEKGILTRESTGLEWKRDYQTMVKMIEMIVQRTGFGDVLADGWLRLAREFDDIEKDMPVIKGLDVVFDPRLLRMGTMEFEQVVNPKGAHVASGGSPTYLSPGGSLDKFKMHFYRMGIPESAMDRLYKPPVKEMGIHVGRLTRYSEDWYTVLTSTGVCARAQVNRFYSLELITEFYNAVTGLDVSPETLRLAAERSWNLLRLLNAREGFSRSDDKFPDVWFNELQFGSLQLKLQNFYGGIEITPEIARQMLDDYYDERGWSKENGLPTKDKIRALGLEWFLS
ncbi:MAG: aldehyde ferredoxin oxidoreductase family protein [Candidatus Helarchaeales archaeon]